MTLPCSRFSERVIFWKELGVFMIWMIFRRMIDSLLFLTVPKLLIRLSETLSFSQFLTFLFFFSVFSVKIHKVFVRLLLNTVLFVFHLTSKNMLDLLREFSSTSFSKTSSLLTRILIYLASGF